MTIARPEPLLAGWHLRELTSIPSSRTRTLCATDAWKVGHVLSNRCLLQGAGVGKGRQIAALIKEFMATGGKRILWVSTSADLRFDARRDLTDMRCPDIEVFPRVSVDTHYFAMEPSDSPSYLMMSCASAVCVCDSCPELIGRQGTAPCESWLLRVEHRLCREVFPL